MDDWFQPENEMAIASPALLLFHERIEYNLRLMLEIAGGPARLRPHVKTHKLGPLVRRQIELGITKFKAATIAEAELCGQAGALDVVLSFPPAGPQGARLTELVKRYPRTRFAAVADHPAAIRGLSVAARAAGVSLDVLLDLDVGMGRTGIAPGAEAAELYRLIGTSPGLRAAGLHAYDGHIHDPDAATRHAQAEAAFAPVLELRKSLEQSGLSVPVVIAGGTPTFPFHAKHADRECSPGTAVLWDFGYGEKFTDMPFQIAAVLLTRVVSKPGANRLCLDLGHKAVAAENPLPQRLRLAELPDAVFVMHSEEHLVIETARAGEFAIGQTLHAFPKHVCPTVALHAEAILIEGRKTAAHWPIPARGRRLTV